MAEQIAAQALETAEDTIRTLRGAVEALTSERQQLEEELAEKEAELIRLAQEAEANQIKQNFPTAAGAETERPVKQGGKKLAQELSDKLSFYYKDFSTMNGKRLTAEDGELMYHILGYVFDTLKKSGVELKK